MQGPLLYASEKPARDKQEDAEKHELSEWQRSEEKNREGSPCWKIADELNLELIN